MLTAATDGRFKKCSASSHSISAGNNLNNGKHLLSKVQKARVAGKGLTCWQPKDIACMASDAVATPGR